MEIFILEEKKKKHKWVGWGAIVCDSVSHTWEKPVCLDHKPTIHTGVSFTWATAPRKRSTLWPPQPEPGT